ncbi:MAG: tripartite tricarboxylate transporter substrate binding protein [Rhodovarius sp.]|nr:tripartite tricarboxylate transporter substrate binding protein [Rhodovarius sp.]MCX7932885.1 tripartite tricarboxylate transporter substrate binding protein [Rhodovarius sp.]MDW8315542.1 tripartite tricarboxylate transporter substrate binding protein [Rhodovarius sp.]
MSAIPRRSLLAAPGLLAALPATAQEWTPTGPVRLINGFPPGGSPDILARAMASHVQTLLGQPMVVENRAGAGGVIGARAAAQAAPDGHTILLAVISHVLQPYMNEQAGFRVEDFRAVTWLATTPLAVVVRHDFPARTIQEWDRLVRANPDRYTAATAGQGTPHHMATELYMQATGARLRMVPYRGTAPALTDILAGTVDMMFADLAAALGQIRQGALRALAVTTARPVPALPDVPLMSATVVPGYEAYSWVNWWVPARTPDHIVQRLNRVAVQALNQPDVTARAAEVGFLVEGTGVAEAEAFVRREAEKWSSLIRARNLRVET